MPRTLVSIEGTSTSHISLSAGASSLYMTVEENMELGRSRHEGLRSEFDDLEKALWL